MLPPALPLNGGLFIFYFIIIIIIIIILISCCCWQLSTFVVTRTDQLSQQSCTSVNEYQ